MRANVHKIEVDREVRAEHLQREISTLLYQVDCIASLATGVVNKELRLAREHIAKAQEGAKQ